MVVLFIFVILAVAVIWLRHRYGMPATNSVDLVTGAVKVGKSTFSVWLCVITHLRAVIKWAWWKVKPWHWGKEKEFPLLYSNVPIKYWWYREFTIEHLKREKRFNFGSVVYLQEVSFVADSMAYKDDRLNEQLMLFVKLFGHETHGGKMIIETQSLDDCHYAFKRCIGGYIHLTASKKFFGLKIQYRRNVFTSNMAINTNVYDGKESEIKEVWVPFIVWRMFDAFTYSVLTDNLDTKNVGGYNGNLKTENIITARPLKTIHKEIENNEKKYISDI